MEVAWKMSEMQKHAGGEDWLSPDLPAVVRAMLDAALETPSAAVPNKARKGR